MKAHLLMKLPIIFIETEVAMKIWRFNMKPVACLFLLVGCDKSTVTTDWTDVGYKDGYVVGYNKTCELSGTLVYGDWDNKEYMASYNDGYTDGAEECHRSARAKLGN
jgi:hypothetical protein